MFSKVFQSERLIILLSRLENKVQSEYRCQTDTPMGDQSTSA